MYYQSPLLYFPRATTLLLVDSTKGFGMYPTVKVAIFQMTQPPQTSLRVTVMVACSVQTLVHYAVKCSRPLDLKLSSKATLTRAVTGGKTAKTEVLPRFFRIERDSGAAPRCGHHYSSLVCQKSTVAALLTFAWIAGPEIDPSFSVCVMILLFCFQMISCKTQDSCFPVLNKICYAKYCQIFIIYPALLYQLLPTLNFWKLLP